ncbi:hypothetical protein GCM10009795_096830 [Nocardioides hankookensis]|uniref:SH3 domain-containing protein n=1 Tax=Nocardioides hankookensis TaxID=443157 RepID=A0ABW1LLM7_9ACTN
MTNSIADQIPPHTTLRTAQVGEPFQVRLAGVAPGDRDVVTVYDQVVIGDRAIVRSEAGKGFWHVEVDRSSAGSTPTAIFEAHETACFVFPKR